MLLGAILLLDNTLTHCKGNDYHYICHLYRVFKKHRTTSFDSGIAFIPGTSCRGLIYIRSLNKYSFISSLDHRRKLSTLYIEL